MSIFRNSHPAELTIAWAYAENVFFNIGKNKNCKRNIQKCGGKYFNYISKGMLRLIISNRDF